MTKCFFAVDLGATSGRTIIGSFTQEGLVTEEMNRFPNHIIETGGHFYWDIYELYRNILEGLKRAAARQDIEITSIGIDTWGVDSRIPRALPKSISSVCLAAGYMS